jgi:hypothetical protein
MKGWFGRLIGVGIALVAIILLGVFLLYSRLPDIASDKLTKMLKVAVQIEDIRLSYDKITIDSLEIANVPKSTLPKAFSVETLEFDTLLTNYMKDDIVIDEISLDKVYLGLEFVSPSNLTSNWTAILSPLTEESDSSKKDAKKATKGSSLEEKKTVLIKKLVLTNIQVEIVYKSKGSAVTKLAPIDKIVLTNISTEDGLPMNQIANSVLGEMLKSVLIKENMKDALDSLTQSPENTVEGLFKGLFGG